MSLSLSLSLSLSIYIYILGTWGYFDTNSYTLIFAIVNNLCEFSQIFFSDFSCQNVKIFLDKMVSQRGKCPNTLILYTT